MRSGSLGKACKIMESMVQEMNIFGSRFSSSTPAIVIYVSYEDCLKANKRVLLK